MGEVGAKSGSTLKFELIHEVSHHRRDAASTYSK
jgi:hypothetical protein